MQKKLKDKTELFLITKPVTASITTDASDAGIGFIINTEKRTDCMGKVRVVCLEKNTTSSAPEGHINWKEIEAVLKALEMHKEELGRKHFVWYSDSTTTLAAIRRQGTQKLSKAAWELTKNVLDLAEQKKITILKKHVSGRLNCAVDALLRPDEEKKAV